MRRRARAHRGAPPQRSRRGRRPDRPAGAVRRDGAGRISRRSAGAARAGARSPRSGRRQLHARQPAGTGRHGHRVARASQRRSLRSARRSEAAQSGLARTGRHRTLSSRRPGARPPDASQHRATDRCRRHADGPALSRDRVRRRRDDHQVVRCAATRSDGARAAVSRCPRCRRACARASSSSIATSSRRTSW